jgi:O-antigen/teichoic acid export membrane protein
MLRTVQVRAQNYVSLINQRSRNIAINVIKSLVIKGGSVVIGLLLVPLSIQYVNPQQYGIWLTISSIVAWMGFFDIGLGNGLRNHLATSKSSEDLLAAQGYVSTTYALLMLIAGILLICFYLINPYVAWSSVLHIPLNLQHIISPVFLIVVSSFCIQFVVQIINVVLTATHQPSKASLISFVGQIMIFLAIVVVKSFFKPSLIVLAVIFTWIPVLVLLFANIFYFKTSLKQLVPTFSSINFKYSKDILTTGAAFFVIQIGTLVLFQTDNVLIARLINAQSVTTFNVVQKYFGIITMVFSIIITPYWSAFTEANGRSEWMWIINSVKRLRIIWGIISIAIVPLFVALASYFYKVWLGKSLDIPLSLSISMGFYVIGYICLSVSCMFLNGMGKTKVQIMLYIFSSLINIPLSIFLEHRYGIIGIVYSNVIVFLIMNLVLWVQVNQILKSLKDKI